MRSKALLLAAQLTLLLLVLGCRTDKAKEAQNQSPQPAASPAATDNAASQNAPSQSNPPAGAPAANAPPAAGESKPTASYKEMPPPESAKTSETAVKPTPVPTPPPPIVIAAGTVLNVRTTSPISTGSAKPNQEFEGSLSKPLMVGDTIVVPVGAPVAGVIPQAKSAGRIKGEGTLTLALTSITVKGKPYQIATQTWSQEAKGRGKRSAAMIGGGGGAGALIGGLAGGGKGAAIGALAGAGAGTAGATMTGKRDVAIPAESILVFKLSKPLTLPPMQGVPAGEGAPELKQRPQETQPDSQPPQGSQPPQPGQGQQQPPPQPRR
jgi:hypothetical protein